MRLMSLRSSFANDGTRKESMINTPLSPITNPAFVRSWCSQTYTPVSSSTVSFVKRSVNLLSSLCTGALRPVYVNAVPSGLMTSLAT